MTTTLEHKIPAELRERLGMLPFKPRPPGTELTRTKEVAVLNLRKRETVGPGDDSITKVWSRRCRSRGTRAKAMDLYEQAIRAAHESELLHHEALANELSARFLTPTWRDRGRSRSCARRSSNSAR